MLNKETKRKIIFDIILVGVLLVIALSAFFIYRAFQNKNGASEDVGEYAVVKYENTVIGRYPLDTNAEYSINGGKNVLKIEDGKAYIIYADCPDKLCISQGKISSSEEKIICLPNKIFVTVE